LLKKIKEEGKKEGAEKLYTIYKTLAYRNTHREVFEAGEYIPIDIPGAHLAFIRRYGKDWVLVIVPLIRMIAGLTDQLSVTLPEGAPDKWIDAFTGETFHASGAQLDLMGSLKKFPVALLTGSVSL
jgi:(1->4)-alpha-D-glucan 1-alpha-D-glucosylmutase